MNEKSHLGKIYLTLKQVGFFSDIQLQLSDFLFLAKQFLVFIIDDWFF